MITRGQFVAALVGVQILVLGTAVLAIRGIVGSPPSDELVADGPPQNFAVGESPRLDVDIGYADLTIHADRTSDVGVSMGAGDSRSLFQQNSSVSLRKDGNTVRISLTDPNRWSTGDDRIVRVSVPPATRVTIIRAGVIEANGLRAEASIHSVGEGSVTIDGYGAPELRVSAGGPISLDRVVTERLDARTDDRIEGTALDLRNGSVESGDRVALGFVSRANTLIDAAADSGEIAAPTIAGASAARRNASDEVDASSRTVRLGAGDGHLAVHARDGNIALSQER